MCNRSFASKENVFSRLFPHHVCLKVSWQDKYCITPSKALHHMLKLWTEYSIKNSSTYHFSHIMLTVNTGTQFRHSKVNAAIRNLTRSKTAAQMILWTCDHCDPITETSYAQNVGFQMLDVRLPKHPNFYVTWNLFLAVRSFQPFFQWLKSSDKPTGSRHGYIGHLTCTGCCLAYKISSTQ